METILVFCPAQHRVDGDTLLSESFQTTGQTKKLWLNKIQPHNTLYLKAI